MNDALSARVKEGWTGPGRRDGVISRLTEQDDALHMDRKGMYEWWYFDAHLEGGYTAVAFFHASNPNPGTAGQAGVELVLLTPDGHRTQMFVKYDRDELEASRERPDVKIGHNYMRSDYSGKLPTYEIYLDERDIGFHLEYTSTVRGWKPGDGYSHFADKGYFAWIVPFARANVEGTIRIGDQKLDVKGVGYHDHNWLNFPFQRIIEYWMWGRVYSDNYTLSYAYIKCNKSVDEHAVKVLMVAEKEEPFISTGEFDFLPEDFEFSPRAGHSYPKSLTMKVPGGLEVRLKVRKVLEAEDMLTRFNAFLRVLAKYLLKMKPGYFRLLSSFEIDVNGRGISKRETGTTLHEIVIFKPVV